VAHHLQQKDVTEQQRGHRHEAEDDDGLDRHRGAPADIHRQEVHPVPLSVLRTGPLGPRSAASRDTRLATQRLPNREQSGPVRSTESGKM
jgi:hypothetical protein